MKVNERALCGAKTATNILNFPAKPGVERRMFGNDPLLIAAFDSGRTSGRHGRSISSPYRIDTPMHDAWNYGFAIGLQQDLHANGRRQERRKAAR